MLQSLSSYRGDHARTGLWRNALCTGLGLCTLLVSACGVDERTLLTSDAASGAGGASGSPSVPAEGGDDERPAPLPRCVYLGASVEAGCETMISNPGFAKNVAGWSAEPVGMSEGWQNADATDDPESGSLAIMNLNYKTDQEALGGSNGGAARQCVPVTPGTTYGLAADVFIPSGQGMGFEGDYTSVATLSVFYYEGAECSGRSLSNFTSKAVSKTDEWVHIEGSTPAPKESQAMAVRLATLKPFRQIMFVAYFDNVFVREYSAP